MNKIASLLAVTLLLASSIARAEEDDSEDPGSSDDLRYCLDLPTAQEIAKCAGEISPGSKGRTYSREEVARILSEERVNTPASKSDSPDAAAEADKDTSPETTEGNND